MAANTVIKKQLAGFVEFLRDSEKSPATIEKYARDVSAFADFVGGSELCRAAVLSYKGEIGAKYAVSSANSMLAAINTFFRFIGRPELSVRQFKQQKEVYCSEKRELSRSEYERLVLAAKKAKNDRLELIIQTICATGMRVSELHFLTVDAVKRGEARVNCKGKRRAVFLVPALQKKLSLYIKKKKIRFGQVFVTKSGAPINRTNIWREMKALCKTARVDSAKVFPHNLRHLFARTFYEKEKDIAKLADILGHSSINTTRIYIITTGAEHRRRMESMHLII